MKQTYLRPETELQFLTMESNACTTTSGGNENYTPIGGIWDSINF